MTWLIGLDVIAALVLVGCGAGCSGGGEGGTGSPGSARHKSYSTNFPLTENPISEGGRWINGRAAGVDWTNVTTTPGLAFGNHSAVNYTDPTALLTGNWGPDYAVEASVRSVNQNAAYYQEVELRLRSSLSAHSCTGYEINFRCLKTSEAYMQVVRWNGPLGDFTYLANYSGARYGVADGDVVKATITGNVIKVYINNMLMATVTDSVYATGNPGMGFNANVGNTNAGFGFTKWSVTDTNVSGGTTLTRGPGSFARPLPGEPS